MLTQVVQRKIKELREHFDQFSLLPGVKLDGMYKTSWIRLFGTKYTKNVYIAFKVVDDPPQPIFGKVLNIWCFAEFVYFEVAALDTICFDEATQAYKVDEVEGDISFCSYDSLVDYNVFHLKRLSGCNFIPVKYDICDILELHASGDNPFFA